MPKHDDSDVELRGMAPRAVVDVLDAVSGHERITRTELMNRILKSWARGVVMQATVVQRVTRGNPALTDSEWGALE